MIFMFIFHQMYSMAL